MKISLQFFGLPLFGTTFVNGKSPKKKMIGNKEVLVEYWNGNLVYKKQPRKLDAPVIVLSGDTISWTAIEGAVSYTLKVDSTVIPRAASSTDTSLDLSTFTQITPGYHSISLRAEGDYEETATSDFSNSVTYNKLAKLESPTIIISNDSVYITAVDSNTETYTIIARIDGSTIKTANTSKTGSVTIYDLTLMDLDIGEYDITVIAKADNYLDSDESESETYIVIPIWPTPTIELDSDGKTLVTDKVDGVTKYKVYDGDVLLGYIDENGRWSSDTAYVIDGGTAKLMSDYVEEQNLTGTTAKVL